MSKSESFEGC